ncbi:MAG: hypothetical protein ACREND_12340 [Gemmatimonadaceae bacterium]
MTFKTLLKPRRGMALITVLLISMVVTALMVTAAMLNSSTAMIAKYQQRSSVLRWSADAGIEEARTKLNGSKTLYPASGYVTVESNVAVQDASGNVIPDVTRSVYAGPTGISTGQYGVFGSIVSVVKDTHGDQIIRRGEIVQESFAKYAYFTDFEPSTIAFGNGDQIFGPVHSNDNINIYSSGATFFGPVTTAGIVEEPKYGTFKEGFTNHAPSIPFPQTADLAKLQTQASAGGMSIVGTTNGGDGQATTRIEFVALDLNGDGDSTDDNEGFIRVYQSTDAGWVVGDLPTDYSSNGMRNSLNCGHVDAGNFKTAKAHGTTGSDNWLTALESGSRRCYLGGAPELSNGFTATDSKGKWLAWTGTVSPLLTGRPDAQYLWPISRSLNPSWKGVIYVKGKVAISGVLNGQVTLAATDNVVIADDMTYEVDPGKGTCNDILGLFSGNDVVIADNTINSPNKPKSSASYFTYDDTKDEFVQGVILALDIFTVENYDAGSTSAESCEKTTWGRGCLYLTGGIIQDTRGAVGTTAGTGYVKRYSYDACAFSDPPPYFPTTGHFARAHYFEVDPTNFDVASYFASLSPKS